jgi:hypothetical protein
MAMRAARYEQWDEVDWIRMKELYSAAAAELGRAAMYEQWDEVDWIRMEELYDAAEERQWDEVEVRHALEAAVYS